MSVADELVVPTNLDIYLFIHVNRIFMHLVDI